jgi:hypothetical protein
MADPAKTAVGADENSDCASAAGSSAGAKIAGPICDGCQKRAENPLFCGKCGTAYCCRECQLADWNRGYHKALCRITRSKVRFELGTRSSSNLTEGEGVEPMPMPNYVHTPGVRDRETLIARLEALTERDGIVTLTGELFVQLMLMLNRKTRSPGVFATELDPDATRAGYFTTKLRERADGSPCVKVSSWSLSASGVWLLGPLPGDLYYGLGTDRPLTQSLDEWHRLVMDALRQEVAGFADAGEDNYVKAFDIETRLGVFERENFVLYARPVLA